uniref:plant UBX domain-containing protein 8-like isoform X2 n=1 Tax=Erigeron canadensis TaxID=72917 RepID=UPI001CB8982D|nr:plant UBX domain-containing protein 8-like isoform X2 [Erigeron canadensis]
MATVVPDQDSIQTFMSITGSSEPLAIQKLTEHGGDLNQAVNSHFSEGDTNIVHGTNVADAQEDFMDVDEPSEIETHRQPFLPFASARDTMNPFSLLDPNLNRQTIDSGGGVTGSGAFEDASETLPRNVFETHGTLSLDDDDFPSLQASNPIGLGEQNEGVLGGVSHDSRFSPSAPAISHLPDYGIEEQMIQAAIEASKREAEIGQPDDSVSLQRQSESEDPEISVALSASLKSAEQENTVHEPESEAGPSVTRASKLVEVEDAVAVTSLSNGRLDTGSLSIQDEIDHADELPLVRNRSRRVSSRNMGEVNLSSTSGPTQQQNVNSSIESDSDFPSEWGGISSEEHDEAVMLEAAMFGGVPEEDTYRIPSTRHHYMRNGLDRTAGPYTRSVPRPPSPSLTAQRLIREQQDDEYLASLQADRQKELLEQAAREAAMEEERKMEEEAKIKLEQEQEAERQLAAKEASLPQEPTSDNENAVTLLVRMPDGSRLGRRFLKSDKLQYLFDFIDVGRVVKPSTYRLVRPYPRRAFSDTERNLTFNEVGLASKQEALFLEII